MAERYRWTGRWIWDQTDGTEKNVYVLFRRVFDGAEADLHAVLRITACSRYRAYLNGVCIGDGPPKSQPFYTYYDEIPVVLSPGPNVIAVVVNHTGYDDISRGGLLAEISRSPATSAGPTRRAAGGDTISGSVAYAPAIGAQDEATAPIVVTDDSWRVLTSPAWRRDTFFVFFNRVVPYQEHFDARSHTARWETAEFDDSLWGRARVVSWRGAVQPPQVAPWTRLVPRDIPFMDEAVVYPAAVVEVGEVTATANRMRSEDLSVSLSQPGIPLEWSTAVDIESLVTPPGVEHPDTESTKLHRSPRHPATHASARFACSTRHRSDPTAGIREPYAVFDFGRILNGYIDLDVEGPDGAIIEIGYAERLTDGFFINNIEGQFADSYTLTEGPQTWRPFAWKAFRYVKIRIRNTFEYLTIRRLAAAETIYPYRERGFFESSDHVLNRVFDISRYTVRLCSNEYLTDTPWREQGQWLGDVSAVTLGAVYACFGDTALAAKFLRQSAATQYATGFLGNMTNTYSENWQAIIPDFSLWWLMALRKHYRYTGDRSIVDDLYYTAARVVRAVLASRGRSGLVEDMPYWVLIDWANVDRNGACGAFNAILAGALQAMIELAEVRDDMQMSVECRDALEGIHAAFDATFWDDEQSLFVDAVVSGMSTGALSEHTNAAAILFGLSSSEQTARIIDRLWAQGESFSAGKNNGVTEAQPFFTSVVLRALSAAGRPDLALEIIRDRWGARMVAQGAQSTYEEWSRHGSWRNGNSFATMMRSESHAWSAFPARWLIEHLAGITITAPGCTEVRVEPAQTDFDYTAIYPTPKGNVQVTRKGGTTEVTASGSVRVLR